VESALDALSLVEGEVRELVRRRGIDPQAEPSRVRGLVEAVVADYGDRSLTGGLPALVDAPAAVREVVDAVAGFGPLQRYFDDPTVEEIWVNEPGRVFVARAGRSELTTTILGPGTVEDLVERMLSTTGRRVDVSQPFVDASLPDGSRLHVAIPDVTRKHWAVNESQLRSTPLGSRPALQLSSRSRGESNMCSGSPRARRSGRNWIMAIRKWKITKFNEAAEVIEAAEFNRQGEFIVFSDGGGTVAMVRAAEVDRVDRVVE